MGCRFPLDGKTLYAINETRFIVNCVTPYVLRGMANFLISPLLFAIHHLSDLLNRQRQYLPISSAQQ